ncbi:hypothetical protein KCU81_g5428, partial [Aureobasidium melanogenum]|uniref:Uncharacterized protein n=1 Tax=Aureobasidium melanogenum (strain CBS 110374) TaxID=1043003 RepID=A0A074VYR9_AURM1
MKIIKHSPVPSASGNAKYDTLPDDFEMPAFIKFIPLRQCPRMQDTLAWMNAVQSDLDDFTSWDRYRNGELFTRTHSSLRFCQVARITPQTTFQHTIKPIKDYIKEDLLPAIRLLTKANRDRIAQFTELHEKCYSEEFIITKRKIEEDQQEQHITKKRKQDNEKKIDNIVDGLHSLRKSVNEQVGETLPGIRCAFHDFEGEILKLMAMDV